MSQIINEQEKQRLLSTVERTVLYNPITVDKLIEIIELSGEISRKGYNIENLMHYCLNHELAF